MRYRLECLTPTLVGDGGHLSAVDYMVWNGQVNVLDQNRIFRLLAKGPRLDNYLRQIKRADKLDFTSWGGFAQNYADRRIEFEYPSCAGYWEALPSEHLKIPTFLSSSAGPYVPGSAIRGALRTALIHDRVTESVWNGVEKSAAPGNRGRRPSEVLEEAVAGSPGRSRLKGLAISDSEPIGRDALKIYMLRVASLCLRPPDRVELRWKQAPRGSVEAGRPERSTPSFAEMAAPGTAFGGVWSEKEFYRRPEVGKALHWKHPLETAELMQAANRKAADMLASHRRFAEAAGLLRLRDHVASLETRLAESRESGRACLLSIGWGGGYLSKSGADPSNTRFQEVLRNLSPFGKSIRTGLPFPKTRKIVFLGDRPATLPGWVLLEIDGS